MIENVVATRSQHSDHSHFGLHGLFLTFSWKDSIDTVLDLPCIYRCLRYPKVSKMVLHLNCCNPLKVSRLQLKLLTGVKILKIFVNALIQVSCMPCLHLYTMVRKLLKYSELCCSREGQREYSSLLILEIHAVLSVLVLP